MSNAARTARTGAPAYNSCRNRHCPKCQAAAAQQWLRAARPNSCRYVVFTLPGPIADIANQNKAIIYDLLLKVAAETLITIAADPKHLGARIGLTAVLHTWGSAACHHPHAHIIVPGGGLSPDGRHWIACRPGFFYLGAGALTPVPPPVPGKADCRQAGRLQFFGRLLAEPPACKPSSATLQKIEWVVYAGVWWTPTRCSPTCSATPIGSPSPTAGSSPSMARRDVRWKDYRAKGEARYKLMTLDVDEFIRRFLIHVFPGGPSHPPLRPLRQRQSRRQYRIGPPAPRRTRPGPAEREQRWRRWSFRR